VAISGAITKALIAGFFTHRRRRQSRASGVVEPAP
jgi:hypothetical protein